MSWRSRAACLGMDPGLFYPEVGESAVEAKRVCGGCPVRGECLEEGYGEKVGVWGGMSGHQRRDLRRATRRGAA